MSSQFNFIVNLTDPVFRGRYHGKRKHDDDFSSMLERARAAGVRGLIITGGSLHESQEALDLARAHGLHATVGCHPTRSAEFDKYKAGPEGYLKALDEVLSQNTKGKGPAVAVGECGLDYDRLHFASQEVQQKHFRSQLSLAKKHELPLFLHSRAAHADFVRILRDEGFGEDGGIAAGARGGVVHSFTGTEQEAKELMDMGFHIGINGCSLKTEANLKVAKSVPLDKLMLETDAPWCSCTSSHASKGLLDTLPTDLRDLYLPAATKPEKFQAGKPVKGRNEPTAIGAVAWVLCQLHNVTMQELSEQVWQNTIKVFDLQGL
ncbi:Mg-dependent DNase [Schizophyllum commune H4-8]|uniref:Mg-dependent DNase n=1 Tax=Schizophyllum commune (strain H4-8 / FGSC 9210) TaxID=578458 RepID=D8PPQ3_SCHCM|nr:Mg-dependent DNase [Schizophyllum commune H4-8]KAI5898350.1 Mg-dependent DNase [Schizophyllum commune H4-8]